MSLERAAPDHGSFQIYRILMWRSPPSNFLATTVQVPTSISRPISHEIAFHDALSDGRASSFRELGLRQGPEEEHKNPH